MPSYLVDEGGERTHAVIPVEEYERLTTAAERLETVRGFAQEMMEAMGQETESPQNGKQITEQQQQQPAATETAQEEQTGYGWHR